MRFAFLCTEVDLSGGDMGAAYVLPRIVGAGRATQLLMLGDTIDAATADRYGLISELVTEEELAAAVTRELDMPISSAIELDAMTQALLMTTEDHSEFHAAFNAKRKPEWTGR